VRNELERVWKKAGMTQSNVVLWNLLGRTVEKHQNSKSQNASLWVKVWTWHIPSTKQEF